MGVNRMNKKHDTKLIKTLRTTINQYNDRVSSVDPAIRNAAMLGFDAGYVAGWDDAHDMRDNDNKTKKKVQR